MLKLPKSVSKSKKRVGRGYGSGKGGDTSGRGQKGQKSRAKLGILFEGVKMKKSFIKRLPLKRGKDKFKAKEKPLIVKTGYLNLLPGGSEISLELLIKHGIVDKNDAKVYGVKILGGGEVKKKFEIAVPISKSAAKIVEKAGGRIVTVNAKPEELNSKQLKK